MSTRNTRQGPRESSRAFIGNIELQALRAEAVSFEHIAAYGPTSWSTVLGPDGADTLAGRLVSPRVFTVLRATPHLGRLLNGDDALAGADRVSPYTPPAVNATATSESVSRSIVWTR